MQYAQLWLEAPRPEPLPKKRPRNEICCPDNANPYPDYEGSTIFEEGDEEENPRVVIIQL